MHFKRLCLVCLIFTVISTALYADSDYRVGSSDVLKVTILGKMDYKHSEEVTVNYSGNIVVSIMQKSVSVDGKTLNEIDALLTEILTRDYLNNPEVIVEILEFNSKTVLVIGEVKHPGEIALQKSSMSLKDLVMQIGGPSGDMNKTVVVVSPNSDSPDPIVLSLDELLMSSKSDSVMVKPDDIVYILGKDKNLPIQDLDNTVYVFGQVTKPGIVPFSKNMTVLRAIISAGNFSKEASPGRTHVKRRDAENKIQTINVDLDKVISGGDKSKDILLKPGDMVYVPRAIF